MKALKILQLAWNWVGVMLLFGLTLGAGIRWSTPTNRPILRVSTADHTFIQLGFRDDGMVVWREITQAFNTTNSPAEVPPRVQPGWTTNMIITNMILPYIPWTNNVYGTNIAPL